MKKRLKGFYKAEGMDSDYSKLVKKVHIVAGKPSEEILRIAEKGNADMIVMGSIARRVSRMSKVPVLVVPNF